MRASVIEVNEGRKNKKRRSNGITGNGKVRRNF